MHFKKSISVASDSTQLRPLIGLILNSSHWYFAYILVFVWCVCCALAVVACWLDAFTLFYNLCVGLSFGLQLRASGFSL